MNSKRSGHCLCKSHTIYGDLQGRCPLCAISDTAKAIPHKERLAALHGAALRFYGIKPVMPGSRHILLQCIFAFFLIAFYEYVYLDAGFILFVFFCAFSNNRLIVGALVTLHVDVQLNAVCVFLFHVFHPLSLHHMQPWGFCSRATPHKERLPALHVICLHLFRHISQKCS